jgi:hypothetical protein
MNIKKRSAGTAACMLGVLLIFAGCEGPVGPDGDPGNRGLNVWEGPFSFSIGKGESSGPVRDLAEFSAALKAALEALPEDEGTDAEEPVTLKVNGLTLSETEQLYALYGAVSRYVDLDLSGCGGITIPATPGGVYTAQKAKVVSVILPESVEALESGASKNFTGVLAVTTGVFAGFTELTSVTVPGVKFIGGHAFYSCAALTTVEGSQITSIGNYSFYDCQSLETLNFSRLESIGDFGFGGCGAVTSLDMPKLKAVGNNAFQNLLFLENANFPELSSVGQTAFRGCTGLTSLYLPKAAFIGSAAFMNCSVLTAITLGAEPPALGVYGVMTLFGSAWSASGTTITFKVPAASIPDYEAWSLDNDTLIGTMVTRSFEGL